MSDEITPPDGSLTAAAAQFASLFSAQPEDRQASEPQPEPSSAQVDGQAGAAAPEQSASEQASEDPAAAEESAPEPAQPELITVKVDGKEVQVTREELVKGYSFTAHNTQRSQKLAEERKAFEAEAAAVRQERQQYQASLAQIQDVLTTTSPKEPSLATSASPEAFAVEWTQWKQHQDHIARVQAEQERVKALEAADAEKGFRSYVESEQAKLADALPEWTDATKGPTLKKELSDYAKSRGFTEDELGQVYDHRLVVLLHDAMQGHKAKVKAPEIKQRVEKVLETAKPGANTQPAKSDAAKDAMKKLRDSGKVEDAAAAFRAILG